MIIENRIEEARKKQDKLKVLMKNVEFPKGYGYSEDEAKSEIVQSTILGANEIASLSLEQEDVVRVTFENTTSEKTREVICKALDKSQTKFSISRDSLFY